MYKERSFILPYSLYHYSERVLHMSALEERLYLRMLLIQQECEAIPNEPGVVAKMARLPLPEVLTAWKKVRDLFQQTPDGQLQHPEMTELVNKRKRISAARRAAGRIGGKAQRPHYQPLTIEETRSKIVVHNAKPTPTPKVTQTAPEPPEINAGTAKQNPHKAKPKTTLQLVPETAEASPNPTTPTKFQRIENALRRLAQLAGQPNPIIDAKEVRKHLSGHTRLLSLIEDPDFGEEGAAQLMYEQNRAQNRTVSWTEVYEKRYLIRQKMSEGIKFMPIMKPAPTDTQTDDEPVRGRDYRIIINPSGETMILDMETNQPWDESVWRQRRGIPA